KLVEHRCLLTGGYLVVCIFLLGSANCRRDERVSAKLVGTWQLVSRVDRNTSGRVIPEPNLGSDPVGYLIYDSKGHVAAQLMARHRSSASAVITSEGDSNNTAQIAGYDSYFGRYEVDSKTHTVTHILDG